MSRFFAGPMQSIREAERLLHHDDFKAVLRYWKEVVLPGLYREATGAGTTERRDWLAGRASILQELLDEAEKMRMAKSDFSARGKVTRYG